MRLSLVSLAAVMVFTGCVVNNRTDPEQRAPAPLPGHISLTWNFDGRTCLEVPEVRWVRVIIPGERLDQDGYYACNTAGIDGIKLLNFQPGRYNFTVDGVDANNKTIYTASGTLAVNGDISVPVNLTRVGARERMQIYWTFGKGKRNCAAAGVDEVWVRFGNQEPVTWPCRATDTSSGVPVEGVAIGSIDAGTYPIELQGVSLVPRNDGTGVVDRQVWYAVTLNLPVAPGGANNFNVNLDDVAALVTYIPKFGDGRTCATAGVDTIAITLQDKDGSQIGPQAIFQCAGVETGGITWDYLPAADDFDMQSQVWTGTYTVQMEAWDTPYSNHRVLYAGRLTAPVYAGSQNTLTVTMIGR